MSEFSKSYLVSQGLYFIALQALCLP